MHGVSRRGNVRGETERGKEIKDKGSSCYSADESKRGRKVVDR